MLVGVTEAFWLVIAGGIIGLASSVISLAIQRHWRTEDRRRAVDSKALDAAVHKLMAWQDYAVTALGSEPAKG